jgi:hypothetical protein
MTVIEFPDVVCRLGWNGRLSDAVEVQRRTVN